MEILNSEKMKRNNELEFEEIIEEAVNELIDYSNQEDEVEDYLSYYWYREYRQDLIEDEKITEILYETIENLQTSIAVNNLLRVKLYWIEQGYEPSDERVDEYNENVNTLIRSVEYSKRDIEFMKRDVLL